MLINQVELQQGFAQELRGNYNQVSTITTAAQHPKVFFTQEQYQQILQLLTKTGDGKVVETSATVASADASIYFIAFLCRYEAGEWIVDTSHRF